MDFYYSNSQKNAFEKNFQKLFLRTMLKNIPKQALNFPPKSKIENYAKQALNTRRKL